jgi:hypothetical protein
VKLKSKVGVSMFFRYANLFSSKKGRSTYDFCPPVFYAAVSGLLRSYVVDGRFGRLWQ